MKWFGDLELIRCFRERKENRCKDCRLTQAAKTLPNGIEENLVAVVEDVMDDAREELGMPIVCTSGFRCPAHNANVGSKPTSQHIKGQAMDVTAGSPEDNLRLAKILIKNKRYDQCILYVAKGSLKPRFIHVSWKRGGGNRLELRKKVDGESGYHLITSAELNEIMNK